MSQPGVEITSFEQFWPFYLGEHRNPTCRLLHYAGTSSALTMLFLILLGSLSWKLLPLLFVVGYGPAWVGHFMIEKNKPASFKYPLYSFAGDLKMLAYFATGKIDAELAKIGA